MKNLLKDAIRKSSAEYIDARHEKTESMEIVFNKKEIRSVSSSVIDGGHVRALKDGGIAYQSFTDPRRIDEAVGKVESQASARCSLVRANRCLSAQSSHTNCSSRSSFGPRSIITSPGFRARGYGCPS